MTGGTLVDLCAAERVDGTFGDDEGVEVFRVGAEGEEAAGSAGREAPHPVWRADFEAGEGAASIAVGEQDAALAVASDQRAMDVECFVADPASDEPLRCGVWRCRVPGGAEVGRGVCGVSEPVADVGEGEAAPDHEVDCGSVVVVVACGEVDPVAVVAAPGDELGQAGRAQHGVCAGRGLGVADISPCCGDGLEGHAFDDIEVDAVWPVPFHA